MHETSIEDYGAIGDCRTLALVSRFGSIDWCCAPDFSSPSLFAALVDSESGGRFAMTPRGVAQAVQHYLPHTNVLLSRMECEGGVLELTDFMTLAESDDAPQEIVRIAACVAGAITLDVTFDPRPVYASKPASEALCTLRTSFGASTSLTLKAGELHAAILTLVTPAKAGVVGVGITTEAQAKLAATMKYWQGWCNACQYEGDYAEAVQRSALALKLLTHSRTGALVAAGTTSIPESATGARNWDYRFCWLRDSSLVFDAFTSLGYTDESAAFLNWLLHATHVTRPRLQVVYDVYGGHDLKERVLHHLRGYHGIGPVLVGNAASNQQQNDVYGEVILTAADYVARGGKIDDREKELVANFARMACEVWREPDNGIWEIRSAPRHNTYSKLMCWAALDRTLQIHETHPLPIDIALVTRERDAIHADIETNGWDDKTQSYVGYYGGTEPDASLLLMPRLGFAQARAPRMLATTERILRELSVGGLLYRFPPGTRYDGVAGGEHLFAICSFWCVDCLARQGRVDEARAIYEKLLALRNAAGLYAEEFDVKTGRPVGNFPQAFSHVGSITAALSLRAAQGHG
jgi:GH15 family glucan-1,4-alpha-glucosidase